jgi:hypothetical protein
VTPSSRSTGPTLGRRRTTAGHRANRGRSQPIDARLGRRCSARGGCTSPRQGRKGLQEIEPTRVSSTAMDTGPTPARPPSSRRNVRGCVQLRGERGTGGRQRGPTRCGCQAARPTGRASDACATQQRPRISVTRATGAGISAGDLRERGPDRQARQRGAARPERRGPNLGDGPIMR